MTNLVMNYDRMWTLNNGNNHCHIYILSFIHFRVVLILIIVVFYF